MQLAPTVETLRNKIKKSGENSPLKSGHVTLLGACKGQPASIIIEAIEAGISDFGENRVQEAYDKWMPLRKAYPGIRLHLIGPLQTNKVKQALELFDVIHTIDRPKLAEAIAEVMRDEGRGTSEKESRPSLLTTRRFFIQVNTGKESQKSGVIPEEADALIEYCKEKLQLPIAGLMCVPPVGQPPAPHFALLRKIAERHGLKELSMGMSDDFETAVRMGSTCVRIGRGLFGERE